MTLRTYHCAMHAGRLEQRRAIITGGGRGIGAAIAAAYRAEGAEVAIIDLDPSTAEATATRLGCHAVVADLADPDSARTATREAIEDRKSTF